MTNRGCKTNFAFQVQQSGPQLFSGSEDEEDRNEENDSRFNIRPQFEGPAGQKVRKKLINAINHDISF